MIRFTENAVTRIRRASQNVAFAALALSLTTPAAGARDNWALDPATKCRFVTPKSLGASNVHWIGACPDGKASGLGLLLRRGAAKAGPAFYGALRDGVPWIGVVEDNGFRAGRVVAGEIGSGEVAPQERMDAFTTAAKAARAVSAHYAGHRNSASAQYYVEVAKRLEMQIDI